MSWLQEQQGASNCNGLRQYGGFWNNASSCYREIKNRCFKNIKTLPTSYEAHKKAWITSELFTAWLRRLDRCFKNQNRKVAMVVDNCSAHPKDTGLKVKASSSCHRTPQARPNPSMKALSRISKFITENKSSWDN